jgi:AcrR family transcriptional regulator
MGRNQTFIEEDALRTIAQLLTRINPDALSMDYIIKATGVQRQSIYRTWGSKSELIASAIQFASNNASEKDLVGILALTLGSESALEKPVATSLSSLLQKINKGRSTEDLQISIGKYLTNRLRRNK